MQNKNYRYFFVYCLQPLFPNAEFEKRNIFFISEAGNKTATEIFRIKKVK